MGCGNSVLEKAQSYVMDTRHTVDDLPEIMNKVKSANKTEAIKGALGMLQDVCGEEATAQMLLKAKLVGNVTGWVTAKDGDVKRLALSCCSQLSAHECCAGEIGSKEFLGTLTLMMRTKDAALRRELARYFSYAGANPDVRARILEDNIDDQVWLMVTSKDQPTSLLGVIAFCKIADDPEAANKLAAKDIDALIKFFFGRITKSDDTDVERWCLVAIARLSLANEFSDKLALTDKFPILFSKAMDNIASRKLPAALCIANLASNKNLRVKLIKHKAYQLFVEMAKVPSARKDMAEYQRVAALGLKNLASNFDLRALAAKVGALEAVVKMLRSKNLETARYAAKAASELSLHEENGRKMVLGGALKPLLEMAKSGDAYCENEAVSALANLALSEDNQKQFLKEGGMAAIEVMTVSRNPRVAHLAKKLMTRLRMAKLKTAARFAGHVATMQKEIVHKETYGEGGMGMGRGRGGGDSEESGSEED